MKLKESEMCCTTPGTFFKVTSLSFTVAQGGAQVLKKRLESHTHEGSLELTGLQTMGRGRGSDLFYYQLCIRDTSICNQA